MKKMLLLLFIASANTISYAQTHEKTTKDEVKVKKTTTVPQAVHNTFSKHKHHSGVKIKHTKTVEKKNQ